MLKHIFIFCWFSWFNYAAAQNVISKADASTIADQLFEAKIFSQNGRDALKFLIDKDGFKELRDSSEADLQGIKKSEILFFCAGAFAQEALERSGELELRRRVKLMNETVDYAIRDIALDTLKKRFYAALPTFHGRQIEAAIITNEPVDSVDNYSMVFSGFSSFFANNLIHEECSVLGKHRFKILDYFKSSSLIDQRVYNDVLEKIRLGEAKLEMQICQHACMQTVYYNTYEDMKKEQLRFIQNLTDQGLIEKKSQEKLIASYGEYEMKTDLDILSYCKNAVVIKKTDLPQDPFTGYKAIYDSIATILPEFRYKKFNMSFAANIYPNFGGDNFSCQQSCTISMEIDKRVYTHSFIYDSYFINNPADSMQLRFIPHREMTKVVNNWLSDKDTPVRLFHARQWDDKNKQIEESAFGIIVLTEAGYNAWMPGNRPDFLSYEKFSDRFSGKRKEKILTELEKIGLFSHLNKDEIEDGKQLVADAEVTEYLEILDRFPDLIVPMINISPVEGGLVEFVKDVARISKGKFEPEEIMQEGEFDGLTSVKLKFRSNRKEYEIPLNFDNLLSIIDVVRQAIKDENPEADLYGVIYAEGIVGFIVLTHKQYKQVKVLCPGLLEER